MKSLFRLMAVDVDGTLLNSKHEISNRTEYAIKEALNRGVDLVLATGKQYVTIKWIVDLFSLSAPQITCDGAVITDPILGDTLSEICVPQSIAIEVIEVARALGVTIVVARNNQVFVEHLNDDTSYMESYGDPPPIVVPDLRGILNPEPTHLMAIMFRNDILFEKAEAVFKQRFNEMLTVQRSSPYYIEFLSKHASKGKALAYVAKSLGILQQQVIAIGDGHNDISLFSCAGYSVAMGNADWRVRLAADYTTGTNDEDGLARVVERMVSDDN